MVEYVEKENGEEISFLDLKRRQVGMQVALTVGEVLHQRENPFPYALRCHLDKAEAGVSVRKEENALGLKKSVRKKSVPIKFKSLPIENLPKKKKAVSSKLEDGMQEENTGTEKKKSFDPFVDVYYDCAVPGCQDCKELELL